MLLLGSDTFQSDYFPARIGPASDAFDEDLLGDGATAPQLPAPIPGTVQQPAVAAQQVANNVQQERLMNRVRSAARRSIGRLQDALSDQQKRTKIIVGIAVATAAVAGGIGYWLGKKGMPSLQPKVGPSPSKPAANASE